MPTSNSIFMRCPTCMVSYNRKAIQDVLKYAILKFKALHPWCNVVTFLPHFAYLGAARSCDPNGNLHENRDLTQHLEANFHPRKLIFSKRSFKLEYTFKFDFKLLSTVSEPNVKPNATAVFLHTYSMPNQFKILVDGINSLQATQGKLLEVIWTDRKATVNDCLIVQSLIKQSPQLESLKLSDLDMTDSGLAQIHQALVPTHPKTNQFHPSMSSSPFLVSLDLNRNKLGSSDLIGDIVRWTRLEKVLLVRNNLRSPGLIGICDALTWNPVHLKHLDLTSNSICPLGAKRMAQILGKDRIGLMKLGLGYNLLGDVGCQFICRALTRGDLVNCNRGHQSQSRLQELNLSHNQITDAAVPVICSMIRNNVGLQTLNLSHNFFTEAGAAEIVKALGENISLTKVTIRSRILHQSSLLVQQIESICKRNQDHLQSLSCSIPSSLKLLLLRSFLPTELLSMILGYHTDHLSSRDQNLVHSLLLDKDRHLGLVKSDNVFSHLSFLTLCSNSKNN